MNKEVHNMARSVSFVGLGDIGAPMARRVLDAGFALTVWNRTSSKATDLVSAGATLAPDLAAVARAADVVCLCVTDADAIEALVFGANGIATALQPGQLIVDHSTIEPSRTRVFAQRLREVAHCNWLDAPVSGGSPGARAGTLAVFAGGATADLERARAVLQSFAGRITHMGEVGCGQATKACNQLINVGTIGVVSEALALAARCGLDAHRLPQALAGGYADSAILRHYGPRLAAQTFSGLTATTQKDLGIVLQMGRDSDAPLPIISLLESFLRMVVARGYAQDGMAGLMRIYADGPLPGCVEPAA
jgi:3-hydroxyisobutyrate dehydrogenase